MINKLFLTLMLALTAWVFAGCGEARFAGKNITVPQFVLKVPEVDTNPPP